MTPASSRHRTAYRTAGSLRGVLHELFNLSLAQAEALDREDYDRLEELVAKKSTLFPLLKTAADAAEARGWKLHDPSTCPADEACAALWRESADLSRRLQAHEKYVLGQMLARRNQVGERLDALMMKRQAAAGYRAPSHRGATIDTSR
jgi:hypothetical protein